MLLLHRHLLALQLQLRLQGRKLRVQGEELRWDRAHGRQLRKGTLQPLKPLQPRVLLREQLLLHVEQAGCARHASGERCCAWRKWGRGGERTEGAIRELQQRRLAAVAGGSSRRRRRRCVNARCCCGRWCGGEQRWGGRRAVVAWPVQQLVLRLLRKPVHRGVRISAAAAVGVAAAVRVWVGLLRLMLIVMMTTVLVLMQSVMAMAVIWMM
jgi:hypothetical protein